MCHIGMLIVRLFDEAEDIAVDNDTRQGRLADAASEALLGKHVCQK